MNSYLLLGIIAVLAGLLLYTQDREIKRLRELNERLQGAISPALAKASQVTAQQIVERKAERGPLSTKRKSWVAAKNEMENGPEQEADAKHNKVVRAHKDIAI